MGDGKARLGSTRSLQAPLYSFNIAMMKSALAFLSFFAVSALAMPGKVDPSLPPPLICQLSCAFAPPKCSGKTVAVHQGGCWSCCTAPPEPNLCLKHCLLGEDPPTDPEVCASGWFLKKSGDCWQCCDYPGV
ncbi:hypothetical protein HGRIS_005372 [Hohenbuehelia grisea]|uniref:Uncharacterized protein n=1 Tax=Hohenbuehelia grisea TaxID=104357 RepID=A0ABR3JEW6_9AGAR